MFIGGHALSTDNKLRTGAGRSDLWDGAPIKRVRAGDGTSILPGRRLSMHLMAQPDVAQSLLADRALLDQGLLSRILTSFPESAIGTRLWREPAADTPRELNRYHARLMDVLEAPLPLATLAGLAGTDPQILKPPGMAAVAEGAGAVGQVCRPRRSADARRGAVRNDPRPRQ